VYFVSVIIEGTFATLPRTTRGVAIVLGGDAKGKNFLYTNGNSVIIRDIAVSIICLFVMMLVFSAQQLSVCLHLKSFVIVRIKTFKN